MKAEKEDKRVEKKLNNNRLLYFVDHHPSGRPPSRASSSVMEAVASSGEEKKWTPSLGLNFTPPVKWKEGAGEGGSRAGREALTKAATARALSSPPTAAATALKAPLFSKGVERAIETVTLHPAITSHWLPKRGVWGGRVRGQSGRKGLLSAALM